jgi:phage terminase large subunit-like protein
VRDGRVVDPMFLPIIYEFPSSWIKANKHRDLNNAFVTNPNWGLSVDEQVLAQKYREAQEAGEHAVKDFLSKHLNLQTEMSMRANRWPGADFWLSTESKAVTLETLIERSDVITVGGDGGGLDDLLGLALCGRDNVTKRKLVWCKAWAHPSVLERNKQFAAQLLDYAKTGDLVLVERVGDDVLEFAAICKQVHESGKLYKIGLDPSGIAAILEALEEAGIPEDSVIGVTQGWRLNAAIKTFERWLAAGEVEHAAQPLMNWCVSNAMVEPKGNAILITKAASSGGKIDPLMAALNSIELMGHNPEPARKTYGMLIV